LERILELAQTYGLPLLWLGLFVAGLGVPIPEDIFLITGGILTHENHSSLLFAIVVLYSGVIVGDAVVYRLGFRYGEAVLRRKFIARIMTPVRVERVRRYYARYGALTVFLARHVAGLRFPTFLMAGVSRMGFWRFLFWDSLAALISVPFWVWLGYAASKNWKHIHKNITGGVAWALGAVIVGFLIWKFRNDIARAFGFKKKIEGPGAPMISPAEPPQP
jgi:membrane protein DedA with SNARE-associated domain